MIGFCQKGGHGGRGVTLSPPTSEARVWILAWPQVGKLVVAYHWSAVYSTEPWCTVCTGFLCPSNYPSWYDLYTVESDVKPQIKVLSEKIVFKLKKIYKRVQKSYYSSAIFNVQLDYPFCGSSPLLVAYQFWASTSAAHCRKFAQIEHNNLMFARFKYNCVISFDHNMHLHASASNICPLQT